jgi:transcriptional regulator with XRE-family HTH domain
MDFGSYIKELRQKHNYSLRTLGERAGLSYSYISSIENNEGRPSRDAVIALAKGLHVPPDELLQKAGFVPKLTETVKDTDAFVPNLFAARLRESFASGNHTVEDCASKSGISAAALHSWMGLADESTPPSLIDVYKLARLLDVTPDYLYGCSDSPSGFSSYMPRPKNLREILEREEIVFDGIPFDEKDKVKLKKIIYAVFGDE